MIEYDEDEYSGNSGYGHIGRLVDPFGVNLSVAWLDGQNSGIRRQHVLLPKQPGATVTIDGVRQRVVRYTDTGVVLSSQTSVDVSPNNKKTRGGRKRKDNPKKKGTSQSKKKKIFANANAKGQPAQAKTPAQAKAQILVNANAKGLLKRGNKSASRSRPQQNPLENNALRNTRGNNGETKKRLCNRFPTSIKTQLPWKCTRQR